MLNFERRSGRLQSRTRRESPAILGCGCKAKLENHAKNKLREFFCTRASITIFVVKTCISPTSFESIYFLSTVGKMMSIRAISRAIPRSVFRSHVSALRLSSISRPSLLQKFYKPAPVQQTYPAFSTSFTRREPAGDCGIYQFPI